jgi:hypothetical protein
MTCVDLLEWTKARMAHKPITFYRFRGKRRSSISETTIEDFCFAVRQKFGGLTESNPVDAPPFRGSWISEGIEIDYFLWSKLPDNMKQLSSLKNGKVFGADLTPTDYNCSPSSSFWETLIHPLSFLSHQDNTSRCIFEVNFQY